MVHQEAIISFESIVKYNKGHSVDTFSSELLDMSLHPALLSTGVYFFFKGLREKTLLRLFCLHFSINCFSYAGCRILFEEKWLSSQLVLPRALKVRLLLVKNRSCVASAFATIQNKECLNRKTLHLPSFFFERTHHNHLKIKVIIIFTVL